MGGAVRDILLNKEPKDFDFTTNALPEETKEILEKNNLKFYTVGEKFGTIATKWDNEVVEITTHRRDMTPGRHPDVSFTKYLKEDLMRRDFTINSMAMDKEGKIIDFFKGLEHLEKEVIKTTGKAEDRFKEDPLRMLRAIRFASQLNFNIRPSTKRAIREYAPAIFDVSRERWYQELTKLLLGKGVKRGLDLLYNTGLLGFVLPEVFVITLKDPTAKLHSKNLWEHTKAVVDNLPACEEFRWAGLLHDIAKPQTRIESDEVHFFKHEELGAELADQVCRRLRISGHVSNKIVGLAKLHHRLSSVVSRKNDPPVSKKGLRRVIKAVEEYELTIEELLTFFEADCSSENEKSIERHAAHVALLKEAINNMEEEDLRPKLPRGIGHIIMSRFNLQPSEEVGKIINKIQQLLLDGEINPKLSASEMIDIIEKDGI